MAPFTGTLCPKCVKSGPVALARELLYYLPMGPFERLVKLFPREQTPGQRQAARTAVRWTARWNNGRHDQGIARICDAHSRGLFIQHSGPLPAPGARISMRILIPNPVGSATIELEATVRWQGLSEEHDCTGLGVEFDDHHATISRYTRIAAHE